MKGLAVILTQLVACSFQPSPSMATIDGSPVVVDSHHGSGSDSGGRSDSGSVAPCTDSDHDGACDSQTWVCGSKPSDPPDPMYVGGLSNVASADLAGNGKFVVAAAGASLELTYAFGIDVSCGLLVVSCPAQLEFGLVAGDRQGCLFDGTVWSNFFQGQLGQHATITVPTVSGVYDVRANIGMSASCGTTTAWYGSEPGSSNTFAYICVP